MCEKVNRCTNSIDIVSNTGFLFVIPFFFFFEINYHYVLSVTVLLGFNRGKEKDKRTK